MALWNMFNFAISKNSARNLWDRYPNCNAFHKAQVRTEESCDSLEGLSAVDSAGLNLLSEKQFKFLAERKAYSYGKDSKLEWKSKP